MTERLVLWVDFPHKFKAQTTWMSTRVCFCLHSPTYVRSKLVDLLHVVRSELVCKATILDLNAKFRCRCIFKDMAYFRGGVSILVNFRAEIYSYRIKVL